MRMGMIWRERERESAQRNVLFFSTAVGQALNVNQTQKSRHTPSEIRDFKEIPSNFKTDEELK